MYGLAPSYPPATQFPGDVHEIVVTAAQPRAPVAGIWLAVPQCPFTSVATNVLRVPDGAGVGADV
jgi:hypothetical protein